MSAAASARRRVAATRVRAEFRWGHLIKRRPGSGTRGPAGASDGLGAGAGVVGALCVIELFRLQIVSISRACRTNILLRQTPRRKMLSPPQAQIVRDVSKRWNKSFIAGKAKTKLDLHKRWNKLYIKTKSKRIHYLKQADALDLKFRKLMKKVDGINKWLLDHGKTITKARKALAARGYVLRRPKCRK